MPECVRFHATCLSVTTTPYTCFVRIFVSPHTSFVAVFLPQVSEFIKTSSDIMRRRQLLYLGHSFFMDTLSVRQPTVHNAITIMINIFVEIFIVIKPMFANDLTVCADCLVTLLIVVAINAMWKKRSSIVFPRLTSDFCFMDTSDTSIW